jgi:DNA-binding cell septation regulator SpoVG
MKITNYEKVNRGKIKGIFSVEVIPGLFVPNFKLVSGSDGDFVSVPAKKNLKGEYENLVFLKKEVRKEIEDLIKAL